MPNKDEWVMLVIITKRANRKPLAEMLFEHDAHAQIQSYAHGSAKEGLLRALGLKSEENKVFLSCFIRHEKVQEVFQILSDRYHFNQPNTGFAFTLPLEKISY